MEAVADAVLVLPEAGAYDDRGRGGGAADGGVCSACAVSEELVRAFAAKQMAELQGQGLRFRRLPFIRRTVFAVVFADLEQTTEDGR
ncbi:MAG: hypothetical protein U0232_28340 [Thermomicrobiales bacterium]